MKKIEKMFEIASGAALGLCAWIGVAELMFFAIGRVSELSDHPLRTIFDIIKKKFEK